MLVYILNRSGRGSGEGFLSNAQLDLTLQYHIENNEERVSHVQLKPEHAGRGKTAGTEPRNIQL